MTSADPPRELARRLGTGDAVVIGLGSMIGAGVFSAFGPAVTGRRAGPARRAVPGRRGRLVQRHRLRAAGLPAAGAPAARTGAAVRPDDTPVTIEHLFDLCHPGAVAGGMDRRPFRAASLAERTGRSTTTPAGAGTGAVPGDVPAGRASPQPGPAAAVTAGTSSDRRHCWVSDGRPAAPRAAGLLVEWRQLGGAWQGRVAYVVDVGGEATLVEAWVPASQLERATEA